MIETPSRVTLFSFFIYGLLLSVAGLALLFSDALPVFVPVAAAYIGLILVWIISGGGLLLGFDRAKDLALSTALLHILFALSWVAALYDLIPVFVSDERLIEPARTAAIATCFVIGMAIPGWLFYRLAGQISEKMLDRPALVPLLLSLTAVFAVVAAVLALPWPFFTGWIEGTVGRLLFAVFGLLLALAAGLRWIRTGLLALIFVFVATAFSLTIDGVSGGAQLVSVFLTPLIVGTLVTAYLLYRLRHRKSGF